MSNKKLFLIMLITLILITIGGVWASEDAVADNLTSSDAAELSVSDSVDTKTDTYQTNVNTTSQTTDDSAEADDSSKNTNGELLGATGDEDLLGETKPFSDLSNIISNAPAGSTVDLYYDYVGSGSKISISKNLVINGNNHIIDRESSGQIFSISSRVSVTFQNITFKNVNAGSSGGVLNAQNAGTITFENCNFSNNIVTGTSNYGAAIYANAVTQLIINNCNFNNNVAPSNGGAIYIFDSSVTMYNSNFTNNNVSNNNGGGAILIRTTSVDLRNIYFTKCNFKDNHNNNGPYGAIYITGNNGDSSRSLKVKFDDCNFTSNTATTNGGAIGINRIKDTEFNNVKFIGNSADSGASVYVYGNEMNSIKFDYCKFINGTAGTSGSVFTSRLDSINIPVTNCYFEGNKAKSYGIVYFETKKINFNAINCNFTNNEVTNGNGGALFVPTNIVGFLIENCNFTYNTASGNGGAIYFDGSYSNLNIDGWVFEGNSASEGGAIYFAKAMPGLKIQNSNFTNNTATSGKAGAFNVPSGCTNLLLSDLKFKGNGASDVGGALYFAASYNLNIDDGWVFENNYGSEGGAIYFAQSMSGLTVHDVTFKNNTATSGKAGAFNVPSGCTNLLLSDLKFIGNDASDVGGALYFAGSYNNFNIDGWVFENNSASQGGAIYFAQSMPGLTIQNSNFTNNKAKIADTSLGGGAIFIPASSNGVTIYRSNFTGNNASSANGGAIFFKSKSINIIIEESVFDNNNALSGGAIQFYAGNSDDGFTNIDVIKSNFTNNKATQTGSYGGAAITFNKVNDVDFEYCIFDGNYAVNFGALMFDNFRDIYYNRCNFTNNNATDGGAIYYKGTLTRGNSTYIKCYFDHNWANGNGAAIYTLGNNVIIMNSTFTNNHAESWAGVIQMGNQESGFATDGLDITDSLFINNTAWNAGAVDTYGTSNAHIIRCLFDNNAAVSKGGAVYMTGNSGLIDNCNFTNNNASDGSAVAYIPPTESSVGQTKANITNCNFINNTAASSQYGRGVATVWFESSGGKIISCNFTNNSAEISAGIYVNIREVTIKDSNFKSLNATTGDGGAIYVENDDRITGTVITNCTFSDTHAYGDGGAIYNNADETTVEKCNFTDVTAGHDGGAIYLSGESGTVSLCNFTASHADNDGGAIYFNSLRGIISYCKFINNTALNGGAIVLANNIQTILNSTFIGNNATGNGGAIYSVGKDVLNIRESIFANNTANNGGAVYYTSFTGNNPNGLVIYNNTFTDNFAFYNGGAVDYVVNGTIPYRDYNLFNNEGVNASGRVTWVHDGKELIHTSLFKNNIDYYMNVSSIIEGNKAIGIIVNVSKRFNKTTTEINITVVNSHGQTVIDNVLYSGVNFRSADWVDEGDYIIIKIHLTRQPIGDYNLTLGIKDDNHNYKEQKINYSSVFTEKGDFVTLQEMVNNATELYRQTGIIQVINLDPGKGYYYDPEYDGEMGQAQINITAPVIINGNGVTIDAHGFCRIFDINADNVTINNIVFKNGNASGNMSNSDNNMSGGAILWRGSNGTLANSTFLENCAYDGGAVFVQSGTSDTITNCEFENNIAEHNGGAVDWNSTNGNLINSRLHDNKAAYGGAVFVGANGGNSQIYNSVFTNNNASERGGAVDWYASSGDIVLSTFINNHADAYGGAVFVGTQSNNGTVYNSTFNSNTAGIKGGAIDWNATGGYVNKSFFYNNVAQNGGAIFVGANSTAGHIINSVFEGNNASLADGRGGAVDWYASSGDIENSNFTNNNAAYGGAVFVGHETDGGNITNSRFESNTATVNGGAVDWNASTGHLTHSYFYDNTANENGGALYIGTNSTGGSAYNNTFVSNSAQNGGAVAWNAANGIINASKFYNNTASQNGGAVFVGAEGTQGHIVDSVFDGNNATSGRGGAVDWYASSGEIYNTTFNNNRGKYGAAVYIGSESHGGNITLSNFTNNEATEEGLGGAIYWDSTNGNVRDSTFRLNNASMGGAIYVKDSDVEGSIVNSTFEENYATGIGGAVYLKNVLNASISNSTFKENSVNNEFGQGGALYIDTATNFLVNDTKFISNEAFEGAVKIENSNGLITGSAFENNNAEFYGGIYISDSESVNVTDTTFTQNDDESNMGIYVLSSTDILLDNLTFNYNGENPLPAIMIRGDVTLNDIEINNWNASSNNAAILFSSGESTVNDSVISGNKAIRVNNAATVYLNRLNNTDAADGDYSVLNYGTLYLNMNNFTNVIINHGNIMTKTTTRILDNGTLEIILNHDAELNASIVDDNNNIIIVPDYKFTANGVICSDLENYDKYHFGTYTSPQQGVYVISFDGDLGLKNNTVENGTLKVKDPNTRLVVNSTQDRQGEIVTVKAYIIVEGGIDPSGNVSFTVNGVKGYNEVTTEIINGTTLVATLVLNNLTPDTYFVTAVYNGDDTHVDCQNDTFFVVNKRDVNISIAVSNIAQGENATAVVTTNANGTVVLSLNGRKEIIIENGIGTFDYADLAPGNYTIYVDYAGNTYYNSASNSTNFTVYKYEFDVKIGETQYNQSAVINITLPEDIDMSKVKVFLNNNDISNLLVNKSNGLYQIVTDPITVVGNYTVNVTYDGDDKYYAREVNGTNFTVTANSVYDFKVTVSPDNIKFGDEVNITITGPAGMEVNVTLDGEIIPVVLDENGTYVITRNNLTAGDHRISANTTGDENYTSKEIVKTFTVYPANPEMTINVTQPISPNSPANVTVTVGKNATGMVYIKINGTTTPVEVIDGVAVLPIDTSKPGDYFVTAQFVSDDDNYKSAKNLTGVTYTVDRYNTTISSTPEVADNNNVTVTVIVNGTANGSVVLILDNNTRYEANVTDGVAIVNLGIIDDQREYTYNVTYSGDSNLNSNTTTGNFTVGGLNNYTVNVTISDTQYGDNTTIKVTIDEPAMGGNVTVYVDETPYTAELVDGAYVVVTPALAVGNYTVNVTYEAIAPYADKNNTGNILTVKTNSSYTFIVDVIPAPFGEDTVINITGPAGENVTVTIDGVEETVTLDENGTAIIKRDNLTAGPHTVVANITGNENYTSKEISKTINVPAAAPELSIDITQPIAPNAPANITVFVGKNASGTVVVSIDGNVYGSDEVNEDGYAVIPIVDTSVPGTYNVTVKYYAGENDNYNTSSNSTGKTFIVDRYNSTITSNVSIAPNNNVTVTVTVDGAGDDSNVTLTLSNGVTKTVNVVDGVATFDLGVFDEQIFYNYTAVFNGDKNLNTNSTTGNFTVGGLNNYTVNVTISDTQFGDNTTIKVTIDEPAVGGTVTVYVDETPYTADLVDGVYVVVTPALAVGNYTVNVTYEANAPYADKNNNNNTLTVKTNSSYTFIVDVIPAPFGEDTIINITGPAGENVTVTIDGVEESVTLDENGTAIIKRDNLTAGPHTVVANITGNENYTSKEISQIVNVPAAAPELSIDITQPIAPNAPANITVFVGKNATGTVVVSIDGNVYGSDEVNEDGYAVIPIADTSVPGTYNVTVKYYAGENDNYNTSSNSTGKTFIVDRYNSTITSNVSIAPNNNVNVTVTVDGASDGSNVTLTLSNGETKTVNVVDGVATFDLGVFDEQTFYNYTAVFNGDKNLNTNSTTGNFTVGGLNNYTVNVTISDTQFGDNTTIKVTIDESAMGGTVTVYVDETPYTADLVDGAYVVVTPALAVGNYTVNVTYTGNSRYAGKNNTDNILTVKTNSSYLFNVEIIPAPYGEDTVINITGPAGENVTVTIDGIKETVTLDENGTAIIKRDNLTAGPHTVVANITGNENYTSKEIVKSFDVDQHTPEMKVVVTTPVAPTAPANVTVTIGKNATGTVAITINGVTTNVNVTDGVAVLELDTSVPGTYNVTAQYFGDKNYTAGNNNTVTQYVVERYDTAIETGVVIAADNFVKVNVKLNSTAGGNVTIKVGSEEFKAAVVNGNATVDLRVFNQNEIPYDFEVLYSGDARFNENTAAGNFTVGRLDNANVTIDIKPGKYGENTTITVNVPAGADGNVTIYIDGEAHNATINPDGTATIELPLSVGNHTINATFANSSTYTPKNSTNYTVTVEPQDTYPFNVTVSPAPFGNDTVITVNGPEGLDVNVTVDGVVYPLTIGPDGTADLVLRNLTAGKHDVTATTPGNENYTQISNSTSFVIAKQTPKMNVTISDNRVPDTNVTVTVEIGDNATGFVNVVVDGKLYESVEVKDGIAQLNITGLQPNDHTIEVKYLGDDNYNASEVVSNDIVMDKYDTEMNCTVSIDTDNNVTVTVKLNETVRNGTVTIKLDDGRQYSAPVKDGIAIVELGIMDEQRRYEFNATLTDNADFNTKTVEDSFTVDKLRNTTVSINVEPGKYGENTTITVVLPPNAEDGNVTIFIDGKDYPAVIDPVSKTATIEIPLDVGPHTINATYENSTNYADKNSDNYTVTVNPQDKFPFELTVEPQDPLYGGDVTITVTAPEGLNDVNITVDGQTVNVPVGADGKAVYTLNNLSGGSHTVVASFGGNENYTAINNSTSFTIGKITPTISVSVDENIEAGQNALISVEIDANATGFVNIKVDGVDHLVEITDGKAEYTVKTPAPGKHNITVSYSGNVNYTAHSEDANFTVGTYPTTVEVLEPEVDENNNVTVRVKVNGTKGNITVTLPDGKNYTADVGPDGIAEIPVGVLPKGESELNITYSGDDNFAPVTVTESITVPALRNYTLPVESETVKYGEAAVVNVVLPDGAHLENLTFYVDGKAVSDGITAEGNNVKLTINNLTAGNHTVVVKYAEDEFYADNENSTTFTVETTQPDTFKVDISEPNNVGDTVNVTVTLPEDATGTITVKVNGTEYSGKVENGTVTVIIPKLGNGTYPVNVTYSGDSNYDAIYNDTESIVVDKNVPEISAVTSPIKRGDAAIVNVTIPGDATGTVTVEVGGVSKTVAVTGGVNSISVEGIPVGENQTVKVTYNGDDKYTPNTYETELTVLPKDTGADDFKVDDKGNGTVVVSAPEGATGNITITIGDENYTAEIIDGVAVIDYADKTNQTPGVHDIKVTYSGDENNTAVEFNSTANVPKWDSQVNVNVPTIRQGDVAKVNVTVTSPEGRGYTPNGTVRVKVDGKEGYFGTLDENGQAIIDVPGLVEGPHTIDVVYDGNDYYLNATGSGNVEVQAPITYKVNGTGNDSEVDVKVPGNGTVEIFIDNEPRDVSTDENGNAKANLTGLLPGQHNITIKYTDENNVVSYVNSTVVVPRWTSMVEASAATIRQGDSALIKVKVDSDETGTVYIDIDGTGYYGVLENGTVTINASGIKKGTYTGNVTYLGDGKYDPSNNTFTLVVESEITIDIDGAGDNSKVVVKLPENGTDNVTVTVDGNEYPVTIVNGTAVADLSGLPAGDYNVTVIYTDKDGTQSVATKTVKVYDSINVADEIKRGWNSPFDAEAEFLDSEGRVLQNTTVQFTIDGKTYDIVTDEKGIGKLTTSHLPIGTYEATIKNTVTGETLTRKVTIVKRIIENNDLTTDYLEGKYYSVKVIGDDGNPVSAGEVVGISVNGVGYVIKTDKDGVAQLKINLVPKKYTIKAEYAKYQVTNKITVKQTMKLVKKTVTVKKGKKITLKATLKWTNGKAIKGKVIKFKFKGKTYKAKTNSKGVAKVVIKKKSVLKKLKKGKKYTYTATYVKNKLKGKVKIK